MPQNGSKNLISLADRTTNEKREIAIKGGKASGEARRRRKSFKEQLLLMLETDPSIQDKLINKLIERAYKTGERNGNAANRAFELIRETIGEAPVEEKKLTVDYEDLTPLGTLLGVDNAQNTNN